MKNSSLIFSLVLFFLTSCGEKNIYFEYHTVDTLAWNKDSLEQFDVEITDSLNLFNLYIYIRNTADYPYQNCWLFLSEKDPSGGLKKDTIEFFLADQRGRWLGNGVGSTKEMPILYQTSRRFEEKGLYRFEIGHGMRDADLIGISDVGMRIEKVDYGKK